MRQDLSLLDGGPRHARTSSRQQWSPGTAPLWTKALGLWPLLTRRCLLCLQTDTSDPEKVVSTFLKVSSVFKDEATVRTAVQDAVGNVGYGSWVASASWWLQGSVTFLVTGMPLLQWSCMSCSPALPTCFSVRFLLGALLSVVL